MFDVNTILNNPNRAESPRPSRPSIAKTITPPYVVETDLFDRRFSIDWNGSSLVPALLNPERPEYIRSEWPKFPGKHQFHLDRIYQFPFVPNLLLSRLLVRLLHISDTHALWADGIIAGIKNARFFIEHTVRIPEFQENQEDTVKHELVLQVRSHINVAAREKFRFLVDMIESLVKQWPNLEPSRFAYNPRDLDRKVESPAKISIELVESLVLKGQEQIKSPNNEVRISEIAPDIVMEWYHGQYISIEDISNCTSLGEGGFASVIRGTWNNREVAVKQLKLSLHQTSQERSKLFHDFRQEVFIQHQLKHKNIVELVGISMAPFSLVMEYVPTGSLYDYVRDYSQYVSWTMRIRIARELAEAIKFMHEQSPPIVHLDLKSPNVLLNLLSNQACVKVADFGTGKVLTEQNITGRFVDNPVWLAPEIILHKSYNEKVDTYAFGVILWETVSRSNFFGEWSFWTEIEERIITGERPTIPTDITPPEFINIISTCWDQDPSNRPSFNLVLSELDKIHQQMDHIEKTFGEIEKLQFLTLQQDDDEKNLSTETSTKEDIPQQPLSVLKMSIIQEADQCRLPLPKERKKRTNKKISLRGRQNNTQRFSSITTNDVLYNHFETFLTETIQAEQDLRFYAQAKRFQDSISSGDKLRSYTLRIASEYLGFSAINPTCCLKLLDRPELVKNVIDAILLNDINNHIFSALLEIVEMNLRRQFMIFLSQYQTHDRKHKTRSADNLSRRARITQDTPLHHSVFRSNDEDSERILPYILSEYSTEFENYLLETYGKPYLELLRFYQSIVHFSTKPLSQVLVVSVAGNLVDAFLEPSKEYLPFLDSAKVSLVKEQLVRRNVNQNIFDGLKEDIEILLEEKCQSRFGADVVAPKSKRKKRKLNRLGFKKK